jgi:hypothetical protein
METEEKSSQCGDRVDGDLDAGHGYKSELVIDKTLIFLGLE